MASTAWPRKIIHIDMDAFFAAVEIRDNPALKGKPVIVGGDPRKRGVVSTASYEARKYGIRSAMPAATAKRLCPQAVFLKPNFRKYEAASRQIQAILKQHTDLVEMASLDEAYLDVTRHRLNIVDPVTIARLIRQNVFAVTKLTASAGVAPNKFLAKIASDFKKPDGLTVIRPDEVERFLKDLPVRKIPGVGPVTEERLAKLGIKTCGELALRSLPELKRLLGSSSGEFLNERAMGIDESEVIPFWESKQMSTEETFEKDEKNILILKRKLMQFAREVFESLSGDGRSGRTIVLKVKYFDFKVITRSLTLSSPPASAQEIFDIAARLLETRTEAGRKPIRLLGLGISGLISSEEAEPLTLQRELF